MEVEYGGIKATGGKLFIIISLLGTTVSSLGTIIFSLGASIFLIGIIIS